MSREEEGRSAGCGSVKKREHAGRSLARTNPSLNPLSFSSLGLTGMLPMLMEKDLHHRVTAMANTFGPVFKMRVMQFHVREERRGEERRRKRERRGRGLPGARSERRRKTHDRADAIHSPVRSGPLFARALRPPPLCQGPAAAAVSRHWPPARSSLPRPRPRSRARVRCFCPTAASLCFRSLSGLPRLRTHLSAA